MASTSVAQRFGSQAVAGQYAGAETVLRFAEVGDELGALRHGCGVFDLSWRSKLVVSGEDRGRWLNGMVTNNTRELRQDCGNYNFLLDAQGHLQADLAVYQRGDFYLLETEARLLPVVQEFLDRYIIMDDVELGDISTRLTSLGVAGPRATEILCACGLKPGSAKPGQVLDGSWNGIGFSLVRDVIEARNWYELWLAPENVETVWNHLLNEGAAPVGAEALEWQRILLGLPRVGLDTGAKDLPQETAQEYALHYSKGCYIGQEIVERIHARGQVHRRLTGFLVDGDRPAPGSPVLEGEKEVGIITSSAEMMVDGVRRMVALGYLRREAAARQKSFESPGSVLHIAPLPFQF